RLTQVFANILNNAAKFTPRDGEIALVARIEGTRARVSIRDNGPGIPPSLLGEIFAAFRQVDTSLSRSQSGLGIGLWLAKQIVEMHGGSIAAYSEGTGKGSEFVVSLPLLTTAPAGHADDDRERRQTDAIAAHRILVVDDLAESAETLAMVLDSLGQE